MKKIFLSIILLAYFMANTNAQNVGVGTANPMPSAQLDVNSTSRGFLPPRMTKADRDAIIAPVAGLMIWCINCYVNGEAQVYNGFNWTNMIGGPPSDISLGDSFGGGTIIYFLKPGDFGYANGIKHGLIVARTDQNTESEWGCHGTLVNGTSVILGSGQVNTIKINTVCLTENIAARLCNNLLLNGFDDWYLPSKDELDKIYSSNYLISLFTGIYWSSSEISSGVAWAQDFGNGNQQTLSKTQLVKVRAVRSF